MTVRFEELTREQIKSIAPNAIAVLPTASIEQHGPHLPVVTDTLLCGTVALRAAELAQEKSGGKTRVLVAPVMSYCNSHHHRPFAGVLSLAAPTYIAAVIDIMEGLALSGFRKLMILNGHGGNTDSNAVVGLDFVNRLGHDVSIATAAYWDIARPAIVEAGIMPGARVPGHAGRFETAMVMAIRPDLVNQEGLGQTSDQSKASQGLFSQALVGGTVQTHGTWATSTGYSDEPGAATPEDGKKLLEITVNKVADFLVAFDETTK
jgi:creatinine amidohydrolase